MAKKLNEYQLPVEKNGVPSEIPVKPSPKENANWHVKHKGANYHLDSKKTVKKLFKQLGYEIKD